MAWLKGAFIGLLVAVDLILIALLMRPGRGVADAIISRSSASVPPPTQTTTAISPTTSPTTSATASVPKPGTPTRLKSIVVALDSKVAWRATVGSCDRGGAKLESTSDGGATWSTRDAPLDVVTRIQVTSANEAFVVGARSDCRLVLIDTSDGGATWAPPQVASGTWALSPKGTSTLLVPSGQTAEPCDGQAAVDFSRGATTDSAVVLCGTGMVRRTTDSGARWSDVSEATGAYAVSAGSTGTQAYVAGAGEECAGVQLWSVTSSGPKALGCAKVPVKNVKPGAVALSVSGKSAWLLVRGEVWKSSDGLQTWKPAA
ncbi:MAG TPA: hypothetical protein VFJ22_06875 [Dermatophilaceae bacterium]|jgi:hypothetical protein|nr:hypothetical protein [Dermatophilaceae bacterium]